MNSVILLVSVLFAGADAAQAQAPVTPAPAVVDSSCGSSCGTCCDVCCEPRIGFLDRLKARLQSMRWNSCNTCEVACTPCAPVTCAPVTCAPVACNPCPAPVCTTTVCDPCANVCKPSLLERLRSMFRRNSCCEISCNTCETGCATGSCGSTVVSPTTPAQGAPKVGGPETIPNPPKEMPKGDKKVEDLHSSNIPTLDVTPTSATSPF